MLLVKRVVRVEIEVPVDPHSPFWSYHDVSDPNGDPLDLLIRAEELEEVACVLTRRALG